MGKTVLPYGLAETSAQLDGAIETMAQVLPLHHSPPDNAL